jgi:Subtilase family
LRRVPIRRLIVLAVAAAAGGVIAYVVLSRPSPPPPKPPVSLSRPVLQVVGKAGDEMRVTSRSGSWRSTDPIRVRYSWLECDLEGKRCSRVPGRGANVIVPPQEPTVVALRGVVTATTRGGSTSVTTRNFEYDMAGQVFAASALQSLRRHPQYGPDQLRAWYGLRSGQDGAGQTIVIPASGRQHGLRTAVDHFAAHYGLPRTCRASRSRDCFQLVVSNAAQKPTQLSRSDETEADVEWAHTIAPGAKIVVIQFEFDHVASLLDKVAALGRAGRASVVSDSWCAPCLGFHAFGRDVVFPHITKACHLPHLVCVQASGDHGSPGATPSNSPYVLAVGGTTFKASPDDATRSEVPWRRSGLGDTDLPVPRPAWQRHVYGGCSHAGGVFSCAKRAVPDVSATAANVPVYRPTRTGFDWSYFHGTSLSAPLWAGLIALTDQALHRDGRPPVGIDELHEVLYRGSVADGLDDIPPHGWDWATGLGSPKAGIVGALTRAIERYRGPR